MLKMMCPKCHGLIISALLAEIDEISCHHCNEGVPVHNILISAHGMTINRDDLLKRFFRYKKLLIEVLEERATIDASADSIESSKKSTDQFIDTLEELMAGARDNFRLQFSLTVPVRLSYNSKIQSGWLVNLSMVGACIETENMYFPPVIGSTVHVDFALPGNASFSIPGMVAWLKSVGKESESSFDIGVKFLEMDDHTRNLLWQVISASVTDAVESSIVRETESHTRDLSS